MKDHNPIEHVDKEPGDDGLLGQYSRPSVYGLRRWLRRRTSPLAEPFLLPIKKHRRTQFEALGPVPGAVVFIGDSITEGGIWDEWFPDTLVSNRGIGAEVIDDLLVRLDTALDRPRAVFLLIGTNDLGGGDRVEDVVARAKRLVEAIIERSGDAPVFVQSVMPRSAAFATDIAEMRSEYRQLITGYPTARFVDLVPALSSPDGVLRKDFSLDGVHLNGAGYRQWVEILRPLVAEVSSEVELQHPKR